VSVVAGFVGLLLVLGGCNHPSTSPTARPIASIGALGDSITRGFDACNFLQECVAKSWATGTDTTVNSHYQRLLAQNSAVAGHAWNVAKVGARSADLPAEAAVLAAHRPDYVTMAIGANDACTATESAMTSRPAFRANVDSALNTIYRARPDTKMLVTSVPNLYRLWQVGHSNKVAQLVWSAGFCRTMLDRPTSTSTSDESRRLRVQKQVVAYNEELAAACGAHPGCRYDNNAVYDYNFRTTELSPFDFFHPNAAGQKKLAEITWGSTGL
jgi:lysophospholipase L1-like esterase